MNNKDVIAALTSNIDDHLVRYNALLDAAVASGDERAIQALYETFPVSALNSQMEESVVVNYDELVAVVDQAIENFEAVAKQKPLTAFDLLQSYLVDSVDALKTPDDFGDLLVTPADISAMVSEARIIKHGKITIVDENAAEDYYNDPSWRLVRHVRLLQDDLRTAATHGVELGDVSNYVKTNYGDFIDTTRERLFSGDKVEWANVVCLERAGFDVIFNKQANQLNIRTSHGVLVV